MRKSYTKATVEPFPLPLGHYRLLRDVTNPSPDKRKKDWRSQPVWKAGWRFIIKETDPSFKKYGLELYRLGEKYASLVSCAPYHEDWNLLVHNLGAELADIVYVREKLGESTLDDVMDQMILEGCITFEEIEALHKRAMDRMQIEYEAEKESTTKDVS